MDQITLDLLKLLKEGADLMPRGDCAARDYWWQRAVAMWAKLLPGAGESNG